MHQMKPDIEALAQSILTYSMDRLRMDPPSIDHPLPQTALEERAGQTITREGLGGQRALELFIETLAPACISEDHPRYLAFVPTAPSEVSTLFDLIVGASNICASSWLEGAGASMRKIRRYGGSPISQGCLRMRVVSLSAAERRAISRRWWRRAMIGESGLRKTSGAGD